MYYRRLPEKRPDDWECLAVGEYGGDKGPEEVVEPVQLSHKAQQREELPADDDHEEAHKVEHRA